MLLTHFLESNRPNLLGKGTFTTLLRLNDCPGPSLDITAPATATMEQKAFLNYSYPTLQSDLFKIPKSINRLGKTYVSFCPFSYGCDNTQQRSGVETDVVTSKTASVK